MRMTTLCYIEQDGKYLMLHRTKKKKDINKDKWIGVGGHAEEGEGPEECLLREVKEETGLTLTSYRFRGLITFISNECEPELMCLFTADGFTGELITCNEGDLVWVDKTQVPELPTWSGTGTAPRHEKRFLKYSVCDRKNRRIKRNHSGGGRACDGGECGKVIHKSVLTPQHPSRSVSEYSVPVIRGWYVLRSQCCRKRPATISGILLHFQNSSEEVRY